MAKCKPFQRHYEPGARRPVETGHNPRQRAIKKLSNHAEIRHLMKDLVLGVEPADDTDDTYAPIREVAEGAKKIDDIVVQDEIIASALFLAHFHAMQAVYKEEPDDWSEQTAANADWQSSITKKVPSDLVRQAIFGSKLDG